MKNIILILKSLFSNQAVLDLRKNKWWMTLIVGILAIFLPWIPYLVSGYTTNAATLLTSTSNYEIDKGFKQILTEDYFKQIKITQTDGKYALDYSGLENYANELSYDSEYNGTNLTAPLFKGTYNDVSGQEAKDHFTPTGYVTKFQNLSYDYYFDNISVDASTLVDTSALSSTSSSSSSTVVEYESGRVTYLEAYYLPGLYANCATSEESKKNSQYVENFVASVILGIGSDNVTHFFPHSYVLFGADFITVAVYPLKAAKSSSFTASGSYSGTINAGFCGVSGLSGSFYDYIQGLNTASTTITTLYTNNFCSFMHEAGRPAYLYSTWMNILVVSCVALGSMLVAAVALFIISKRKSSVYRDTNFLQAINEGVYVTFCPSIIAMAITFFSSSYTIVILVGATLMRVVFMMNRICPPPEQAPESNKPLYQARS